MSILTSDELRTIELRWRPIPNTSIICDPEQAQLVTERIANRSAEADISRLIAAYKLLAAERDKLRADLNFEYSDVRGLTSLLNVAYAKQSELEAQVRELTESQEELAQRLGALLPR